MEALYLLIPLSLLLVALAVWMFFRMSDSGQFDDMQGPAHSILMDDDRPHPARPQADNASAACDLRDDSAPKS
jgi:cbb3-type cytochrome oxidase maturation protein